jgi:hypothetical protein
LDRGCALDSEVTFLASCVRDSYRRMERGSMQLLGVAKRTVTILIAMVVMAVMAGGPRG